MIRIKAIFIAAFSAIAVYWVVQVFFGGLFAFAFWDFSAFTDCLTFAKTMSAVFSRAFGGFLAFGCFIGIYQAVIEEHERENDNIF